MDAGSKKSLRNADTAIIAMDIQIVPITEEQVKGYHACLDMVARERRYLAMVEAPELEASRLWIVANIAKNAPYYVALYQGQVIGWATLDYLKRLDSSTVDVWAWVSTLTIVGRVLEPCSSRQLYKRPVN